jgi:hypothetical protein
LRLSWIGLFSLFLSQSVHYRYMEKLHFFWWYCSLNSEPHACKAGILWRKKLKTAEGGKASHVHWLAESTLWKQLHYWKQVYRFNAIKSQISDWGRVFWDAYVIFVFYSVYVLYYVNWFVNVESFFSSCNGTNLIDHGVQSCWMYCWVWFASILLRIFAFVFTKGIDLWFFFFLTSP